MKMPKQACTLEFKKLATKRVKDGQALLAVTKELGGLVEQTLRNWVKAAAVGKLRDAERDGASPAAGREPEARAGAGNHKMRRRTSRRMLCEVRLD
ncbi:MAG TPA: hypothetical protein PKN13_08055 [Accumulibacter sp.]|nr:hypothetical protein [Accumulibacter sp.]HMW18290.1 hypothetical protein [Accumulibacter sp.]HMX22638.1 hypothetical protein [Accumulibacter sp.]HMY06513.1 hypothetical protein [Accumulibacter sp.]HNC18048.1 hypothetical protein [Accumulibacter sp.]